MYRLYMLQVIDKNTFLFYHHPFYVWGVSSCCGTLRQLCRSNLGICVCTSECQSIYNSWRSSCSCPSRTYYAAECQVFALLAEVDETQSEITTPSVPECAALWWWWLEVDGWELQLSPTPLFLCHFWIHLSQQNEICICAEPCTCMQQHLKYKFVVFSRPPIQSVENTECVLLMMWKLSYVYPLIQLWKKFCRETLGKCLLSILTVYNNNGPLPNILGWDFRGIIK